MNRTPRSNSTLAPMPITRALVLALHAWNAANQRARAAYQAQPIISGPFCEWCGRTSSASPCRNCAKKVTR